MNKAFCIALAVVGWSAFASFERPTVTFHVSPTGDDAADGSAAHPVRTLERAVDLAAGILSDAKREIVLADGFYSLSQTVMIPREARDITIRAANRRQAVLSGAVKLTGWRRDAEDARFLVADLPFEPEKGMSYALTSDGKDCPISCWPQKGRMKYTSVVDQWQISYDQTAFPTNFALGSIDLTSVWLELPQEWATTRTLIATNDVAARCFALKSKADMSFKTFNHGFLMMNARVGMTKPGTWMYEAARKRVLYWPKDGEDAAKIDCRLTRVGAAISVDHSGGINIRGLVVEGCSKSFVRTNPYDAKSTLAAIVLCGADACTVEDCEIRNCAAAGVFAMKPIGCLVKNCHIHDMGGGGIDYFDGGDRSDVIGCEVHDYGKTQTSASGIAMQLSNVKCVGNHVHHGSGNGVVMWSCKSLFASNEIDHVMQKQRDGGGLYGGFVDCVIRDNFCHDIGGWPGLYCDEGSCRNLLTGNRTENCWWPTHMHCTTDIVVSNNVFRHNGGMRWSFQGGGDSVFVDNKIYTTSNITSDYYIANCKEWARNEIFVKSNETYVSKGLRTLPIPLAKARGPIVVPVVREKDGTNAPPRIDAEFGGEYPVHWSKVPGFGVFENGLPAVGAQPSCLMRHCHDGTYLYLHFYMLYPRLSPMPGLMNFNHVWGHGDGVRLFLGDTLEVTLFGDGTATSNDATLPLGKEDFCANKGGWYQGRWMEVRLPMAKFGAARGKQVKFNAVFYNANSGRYRWMFPIQKSDVRTGLLDFPAVDVKEIKR